MDQRYNLAVEVRRDTPGWADLLAAMQEQGKHLSYAKIVVSDRHGATLELRYYGTTAAGSRAKRSSTDTWALDRDDMRGWLTALVPSLALRRVIDDVRPSKIEADDARSARRRERMGL
jgi:hypothetical protein